MPSSASLHQNDLVSAVWMDGLFNNKVVFCTGGNGDICRAQVQAMVQLGANACIVGRNVEKTEWAACEIAQVRKGANVLGYGGVDVREYESLKRAVDQCYTTLGSIDFVISGAAGNFVSSIEGMSARAFKAVVDIDLIGSFNTLKATLPFLKQSALNHRVPTGDTVRSGGRIIFISAASHYQGAALQAHGCSAKAGIDALSSCVAIELGPYGVTSNVIAPGPIAGTEGMRRLATLEGYEKSTSRIPSGRFGTTKEVADATVYLFSETGNYVNGAVLVVDGGAWRTQGVDKSEAYRYPDFLLNPLLPKL